MLDEDGDGIWTVHDESRSGWSSWSVKRKVAAGMAGLILLSLFAGDQDEGSEADTSPAKSSFAAPVESSSPAEEAPNPEPAPQPTQAVRSLDAPDPVGASVAQPGQDDPPAPEVVLASAQVIDGDTLEVAGERIRLGLVDAPEQGQACAREATDFTRSFVAGGVEVLGYATDAYGRTVAEVLDGEGRSLNVALAASGWANDRYLDEFRHENPELARRVEAAFAQAPERGCTAQAAPAPAPAPAPEPEPEPARGGNCHWAYDPCIPIKGNGSGNGDANDLDCGDIRQKVRVINPGDDPYRLDRDNDGWGCESYG